MTEFTYQWNPEWEEDPSMPQLKITKSSLNTFEFCRKQYEFSYIERRKTEPNAAMIKGSIVHNSYYCMGLFPIDDYGDIYQTMAAFETERFVQSRDDDTLGNYLPVGNETVCNAKLDIPADINPKFTLKRDYTVHLQGIIDRVFREDDGFIPVELKTGGWKNNKATGMRKEMAFYKVLMDLDPDCNMNPVTHWAWYFPAANHFQVEPIKKRNENDIPKRIANIIYAYEQGIFPASYFANKCQYCSYIGICDTAQNNEMWSW